MKKVVELRWTSLDGRAEFRPVYDDGSVGPTEQTDIGTDDPCFLKKKKRIEKDRVGKTE